MKFHLFIYILLTFIFSKVYAQFERRWHEEVSQDESLPIERHEAAYVAVGDSFYLLGGRRIQPVSIYDPTKQLWTTGAEPPIELHHFQPVVWKKEIWVGGALTGKYPGETPVPNFYIYNPSNDSWRKGPKIPQERGRGAAGAVIYKDKIYLVCGISDGHRSLHRKWLDEFDLKTGKWRTLPDAPRPRDHFQASVAQDKLFVLGGRRSRAPKNVFGDTERAVDVYDFSTSTWNTLKDSLPTPRAGTFNVTQGGKILVIGGESIRQKKAHNEVEGLSLIHSRFESLPALPEGRHGTGAISWQGGLYIASGCGNKGGRPELKTQFRMGKARISKKWKLNQIVARDPFVWVDSTSKTYYLYLRTSDRAETSSGKHGVSVYTSKNLVEWEGPQVVYEHPKDGWMAPNYPVWAPEMHFYKGKYYLFCTVANPQTKLKPSEGRPPQYLRATHVMVSQSPKGPFVPIRKEPGTPTEWMSLDGTLFEENGLPYMVFCHEWHQTTDGTMEWVQMTEDLGSMVGQPQTLFNASDAPWVREMTEVGAPVYGWVTDGPWFYRSKTGKLIMLWSSFGKGKYTQGISISESGKLKGPWIHLKKPLFNKNGGHGMTFKGLDGKLYIILHHPNNMPYCRAKIFELKDKGHKLVLGKRLKE